jgi:serine palmitoyltransferase
MGQDGTTIGRNKLSLRDNSNYFRMRLRVMGLQYDSPIMPVMVKFLAFREFFKRGFAVVVGFPAVSPPPVSSAVLISAAHSRTSLDRALKEIEEIADIVNIRYHRSHPECLIGK